MRAVILATRLDKGAARARLVALRTVVDRPVLQHVVEQLVQQGARELELVVCDLPEDVRSLLGDGRRWGASVRYHLAREADRPVPAIRRAARGARGSVVLASGDCLVPALVCDASSVTTVFCTPAASGVPATWSGLASLPPRLVDEMPESLDEDAIGPWLIARAHEKGAVRAVHTRYGTRSAAEWVAAQRAALEGELPGLLLGGRQARPGVWIGRGASVHASARLVAPAWVGEDAAVGEWAVVGPGAVIGAGAIVERGAHVEDALVQPGTYLGEALELKGAVAEAGSLTHARLETRVEIADSFLVGPVAPVRGSGPGVGVAARLLAAVLLGLTLPLALAGRAFAGRRAALPRPSLADLFGRVLPGLWQVVRGRLGLVGVTPRDERSLAALPAHWRDACASAPCGLITEPMVQLEADAPEEAVAAADALYTASRSPRHDAWLVGRYLREAVASPLGPARRNAAAA